MQRNRPPRPMRTMLKQIDALPRPERRATIHDGYREMRLCERGADVRRHVIGAFVRMAIPRIVFRSDTLEVVAQVGNDIGVRVFLNRERRRSVLAEQSQKSRRDVAFRDPSHDRQGEIVEAFSVRGHIESRCELFHVRA